MSNTSIIDSKSALGSSGESEPVAPEQEEGVYVPPAVYQRDGLLYIENGGTIPTDICIKSGHKSFKVVEVALRSPKNPRTWFGKQPTLEIGLSRKHNDDRHVAQALTWSLLGLGGIFIAAGAFTLSIIMAVVGLLLVLGSGVFRAMAILTSDDATELDATVKGACQKYLERIPALPEE